MRSVLLVAALLAGACTETNPAMLVDHGVGEGAPAGNDGAEAGCTMQTFYRDADSDGHGDDGQTTQACNAPAGFTGSAGDCDDQDPEAHPGQKKFFTTPSRGTASFDYDCDGVEERLHSALVSCVVSGNKCQGDGWAGSDVPACGQAGPMVTCVKKRSQGCWQSSSEVVQSCR